MPFPTRTGPRGGSETCSKRTLAERSRSKPTLRSTPCSATTRYGASARSPRWTPTDGCAGSSPLSRSAEPCETPWENRRLPLEHGLVSAQENSATTCAERRALQEQTNGDAHDPQ